MKFTFFDVCAGIGAWHEALSLLWWKCIGFSEINEKAEKTYRTLHNGENFRNFWDIMKICPKNLPNFDILIWWFPCQTFSIIGKRWGMNDERGQVIFWIEKILKTKKPKYFILENVKWLVNHEKWETFKKILEILNNAGYNVSSKILKSSDYNIPQIRERIYLVGVRKDLLQKFSFPEKENPTKTLEKFLIDERKEYEFSRQENTWKTFEKYLNNKYNLGKYSLEELLAKNFSIIDTRQSDLRIYEKNSPTLRTGRHGILYVRNGKLRKLSWLEALLLQGFSLEKAQKTLHLSNSDLLAQAGNAFTVDVIFKIAKNLF